MAQKVEPGTNVVPFVPKAATKSPSTEGCATGPTERKINVSLDELKALLADKEEMEIANCSQVQCWVWMDRAEHILKEFAGN